MMHDKLFNPERAARLRSPERALKMPVSRLIAALAPLHGQTWLDVGAGNGFYTMPFAQAVGLDGRVVAIEMQAPMVSLLRQALQDEHVDNVEIVESAVEAFAPEDASVDGVLVGNCYHELQDRAQSLALFRRALRPKGHLLIVDWLHAEDSLEPLPEGGPPPDHRLRLDAINVELKTAGFIADVHLDWFVGNYVVVAQLASP